ncbi:MAG: hypothetical protein KAT25_01295 [Sulfuriflexus sp.]|nr:hypothetical protein [Sulfuriflexus sp.]
MTPILTVEYSCKSGDVEFKEESVPLHSPEELFAYVAPGGGCESIPNEVSEVNMMFLPPAHPNTQNPISDRHATLQLGIVILSGPLSEIAQTANEIIDKAGRGELSDGFLTIIGAG